MTAAYITRWREIYGRISQAATAHARFTPSGNRLFW
jgi:hypothetical protein